MRLKYSRFDNLEVVEGDFLRIEIPTLLHHKPGLLNDRIPGSPCKPHEWWATSPTTLLPTSC